VAPNPAPNTVTAVPIAPDVGVSPLIATVVEPTRSIDVILPTAS
jgi:hypothetical protein